MKITDLDFNCCWQTWFSASYLIKGALSSFWEEKRMIYIEELNKAK